MVRYKNLASTEKLLTSNLFTAFLHSDTGQGRSDTTRNGSLTNPLAGTNLPALNPYP